jgi:hypothetical protein
MGRDCASERRSNRAGRGAEPTAFKKPAKETRPTRRESYSEAFALSPCGLCTAFARNHAPVAHP